MSEHKSGLALWALLKYREIELTSSTQSARHQLLRKYFARLRKLRLMGTPKK